MGKIIWRFRVQVPFPQAGPRNSGYGAVGSMHGLGPCGRPFEPDYPDEKVIIFMTENKIKLTESELRHMVERVCRSVIREELQRYLITEMAYSLKDYKDNVDSLIPQIVENWCLVRYTTLSGDMMENREHWMTELIAHMRNIAQMKLKNGNSQLTKQNAIYYLWNRRDIDSDENVIHMHIAQKFEKEGIKIHGKVYSEVIRDFKNSAKDIINVLVSGSYSMIVQYVNSI